MAVSDINALLKIANTQEFSKFLHLCVDDMLGKTVDFENYTGDIEWSKDELKKAKLLIQANFKNNVLNEDGAFQFPFENVGETLYNDIQKCYEIRKDEIRQNIVKENLLDKDIPLVENIDWKMKWVMGSSSLVTVSEPLLQVDLNCAGSSKPKKETVNFEVNLEQLEELITKLEQVRSGLTN
ncbi:hypothetical protein Trydic_g15907 [Trypoxylus dichotomus]